MKIKQDKIVLKEVSYNICPLCKDIIMYPEGIYFRNGIELHTRCVAVARMRRGSIQGIDKV
jgi:hypothetical protein